MLGGLFAGTEESPGFTLIKNGTKYKMIRGMASATANISKKTIDNGKINQDELEEVVPEGVEAMVPYKGKVSEVIKQLIGGVRSGLSYCGVNNLGDLKKNAEFIRITSAGQIESKAHDVKIN